MSPAQPDTGRWADVASGEDIDYTGIFKKRLDGSTRQAAYYHTGDQAQDERVQFDPDERYSLTDSSSGPEFVEVGARAKCRRMKAKMALALAEAERRFVSIAHRTLKDVLERWREHCTMIHRPAEWANGRLRLWIKMKATEAKIAAARSHEL